MRAAAEIRARHHAEVLTVGVDAYAPEAARTVAEAARSSFGEGPDILVLNSGGPPAVGTTQTDPAGWRSTLQLLAVTPIALATDLLPDMRARHWGRVVAVTSTAVRQPIADLAYSGAGRSALWAWMKTAAAVVAADGVTMNAVMPGRIDTERAEARLMALADEEGISIREARRRMQAEVPMGRHGRPDEVASLVSYLCSGRASYLTGALVPVDGGLIQST